MGIINNDVYTASNGVQKTGAYICFANETLYLVQGSMSMAATSSANAYHVRANYRVYWDKEARDSGKGFIDLQSVSTTVSRSELSSSLYERLYAVLKETYPNSVDELTVPVAPVAPVAPSDPAPADPVAPSDPAPADPVAPSDPAPSSDPVAPSDPAPSDPAQ